MRTRILILLLLMANCSFAQDSELVRIKNTEQFVLESKYFLNEPFTIQVCLPNKYDRDKEYPVLYLLDADKSIGMAKEIADWLTFRNEIKDIIVVGIAYNKDDETWWKNRSRDFCPTLDTLSQFGKNWPDAGGADNFLDFLQFALIPEIERRYNSIPDETGIAGFSFGGLFVSYALFARPELFNNLLIISPPLVWDNSLVIRMEKEYYQKNKVLNKTLFISTSSDEADKLVIIPTGILIDSLRSRSYEGLELIYEHFENETHFTGYPRAFTTGLKSLYKAE